MTYQIFIDGEEGTTGLQIKERLHARPELSLIQLGDQERKNPAARKDAILASDVAILCLPDTAAIEAVSLLDDQPARFIDASTAHRVNNGWVYGFPELRPEQSELIASATRVSNPGCYSTGAIALLRPLISEGVIPPSYPITINAVSGYSGGGKSLILRMEDDKLDAYINSEYFSYGLGLDHKHVPEIISHSGLSLRPLFAPSVGKFRQGMIVQIPLQLCSLPSNPNVEDIFRILSNYYHNKTFVTVADDLEVGDRIGLLDPEELNGTNQMRLFVFGNERYSQVVLCAQLDNLGKGASGQAVQNLNLMLGLPEIAGL
tara:strand:- start:270 stop:1220 length:951 start_codon:yes stop_codon:yes gene_type:complete